MGRTAFHAGSTGSNPVRGTSHQRVDSTPHARSPRTATPTVSPTRREKRLHADDHSHTPFGVLLLALAVLLTFALLWIADETHAHTITRTDCRAITARIDAGLAVKRAAALGCTRHRIHHVHAHRLAACATRVPCIIRYVFGPYGDQAVAVSWCESSHRTNAANGQYLGLFQMGSHERATYGHGSTALVQSQAAHRYFVASGRDWSPWECKP